MDKGLAHRLKLAVIPITLSVILLGACVPTALGHAKAKTTSAKSSGQTAIISHGNRNRREVAITFDDGICGPCVQQIVNTLMKTGAHASFFPNGRNGSRAWNAQA